MFTAGSVVSAVHLLAGLFCPPATRDSSTVKARKKMPVKIGLEALRSELTPSLQSLKRWASTHHELAIAASYSVEYPKNRWTVEALLNTSSAHQDSSGIPWKHASVMFKTLSGTVNLPSSEMSSRMEHMPGYVMTL